MSNTSCDPESSLSWNVADYDLARVAVISSIIVASMSPVTVTGNLLVVLAIWRNESLRSSTYFLVGALSLEYFVSGVLFQPSYSIKELAMALRPSLIKTSVFYYLHLTLGGLGIYTTALTTLTTTLMAIERCLYMTRRRWANSSRVFKLFLVILLLPIPLNVFRTLQILTGSHCLVSQMAIISLVTLCFVVTSLTYLQVYRSIRHHQQQIQASATSTCTPRGPFINMAKYKKSVFTILLILASFYLSYLPFIVNVFLLLFFGQSPRLIAAYKVSVVLMFTLSAITPILYCWRIRQIREGVRQLLYKLLCRD